VNLALTSGAIYLVFTAQEGRCEHAVTAMGEAAFLPLNEGLQLLVQEDLGGPRVALLYDLEVVGSMKEIVRTVTKAPRFAGGAVLSDQVAEALVVEKMLALSASDLAKRNVRFGVFFDPGVAPEGTLEAAAAFRAVGVTEQAAVEEAKEFLLGAVLALPERASVTRDFGSHLACVSPLRPELEMPLSVSLFEGEALPELASRVESTAENWERATLRFTEYVDVMSLMLKAFFLSGRAARARALGYIDASAIAEKLDELGAAKLTLESISEVAAAVAADGGDVEALEGFRLSFAFQRLDEHVKAMKKGLQLARTAVVGGSPAQSGPGSA
jgi:hypothetical protein